MKILLIEDDESIITILTKTLTKQYNYIVDAVKDGETGWEYGTTFEYDLIVLDIQLPHLDSIKLCQRFRGEGYTTPILLLTAQDSSTAKIRGLDAGADDYVVKPFDVAELSARIRALIRRCSSNPMPLMAWGDLLLNPSTCEVSYNGLPLILTTKEYRLLEILLWDSQHVFSTEEIIDRLWSSEDFPVESTVRSHIRRLRHKLSAVGAPADFIATVHGRGYYLKSFPKEDPSSHNFLQNSVATPDQHLLPKNLLPQKSVSAENLPLLLAIVADHHFRQALVQAAQNSQIYTAIAPTLEIAKAWLDAKSFPGCNDRLPQAILLQLSLQSCSQTALDGLQILSRQYPHLPILVVGARNEFTDRLAVIRRGGTLFLEPAIDAQQAIATVIQVLSRTDVETKVMIVDDDRDWLLTLPALLSPWGLKVTTLAEPQEFWTVLHAVMPNVLVLGINMPEIDGFELCQIVRSDRLWRRLPILFVSALGDRQTQNHAFTIGADDYLCKPVIGAELANRILNRMQRFADY